MKQRRLRYIGFVGDSGTNTFQKLSALTPYDDKPITKMMVLDTCKKSAGTRLWNLNNINNNIKGSLADGKQTGKGRLTDKTNDMLQDYYNNAIRTNKK